jgi:pantoate--beta-alanine ligase
MDTVTTIAQVREQVRGWRAQGRRIAFVPTMGNLHAGHMSLIAAARAHGERFIASIFVNPMQFGPNEDYAHYPRTPHADEAMLAAAGCDLMFMPDVAEIYPNGPDNAARVEVPVLSHILDGEFRPGHFQGVATIVTQLLNIVAPDAAIFGEKDFQQLAVIRRMVADLCMPVTIIGAATVREADGLAMSSRNQYLTPAERAIAPIIHQQLLRARTRLQDGVADRDVESAALAALTTAGLRPDYFVVRDAANLQPAPAHSPERVVLVAARLGKARLIDNLRVTR